MEKKYCALTFDDGPNDVVTPVVLEKCKQYGIVASFFVIGSNINDESAKVMKQAFDMGCEINNHSYTHSHMSSGMSKQEMQKEIKDTNDLIHKYTGSTPKFFRPPFIDVSKEMHENIDLTFICGNGSSDWDPNEPKETTAEIIIPKITDGAIILLHDSAHNMKSALALDIIVPALLEKGFEFVTVSELFSKADNENPPRGIVYSNALKQD